MEKKSEALDRGRFYWKAETKTADVYLLADFVDITPTGALVFWREKPGNAEKTQILAFAPGEWLCFHAACCGDGSTTSDIEHWVKKDSFIKDANTA